MAREAVEVAAGTDLVLDHAEACLALSRVLAASGDQRGAAQARSTAESLYAAKDAVFMVGEQASVEAPSSRARQAKLRLAPTNHAAELVLDTLRAEHVPYSDAFRYDDRRKIPGEPIIGAAQLTAAARRKLEQYPHVDPDVFAVRGERLALICMRWRDDAGNQTSSLDLWEINDADEVTDHVRFDEDDFHAAYIELEKRYYAGEGAEFAIIGLPMLEYVKAFWNQDVEAARRTVRPDFRWRAAASALKPGERTLEEIFAWRAERLRTGRVVPRLVGRHSLAIAGRLYLAV